MTAPADAAAAFSVHARDYDAQRRRLVAPFDGFYGAVVDVLAMLPRRVDRVLDLGAGTGLLSEAILAPDLREPFVERVLARVGEPLVLDYVRLNITARRT